MEDFIACCYYLHEKKMEINVENILECFENIEEIEKFKKSIFFSKLFRKLAIVEMLNYYCFFDEDKNGIEGDLNFVENKEDDKNVIKEENKSEKKNSSKKKKKKKNKNIDSDNYSEDINLNNDDISEESYDGKKKKKDKKKKGKSKDNKRKKKKNKSKDKNKNEDYIKNDEIELDFDLDKKNKTTEEKNNISDDSNTSRIKEAFKHLEDIGSEQDFNNFENS